MLKKCESETFTSKYLLREIFRKKSPKKKIFNEGVIFSNTSGLQPAVFTKKGVHLRCFVRNF